MENDANYALVGALALAIVVALFGFVYWFAGPLNSAAMKSYNIVFTGAVSGIGVGTDVQFNGIKVGQVKSIDLDPNDTNHVVALVEVAADTPIKADTKTLMGFQGLTGIGSIQFSGGSQAAGPPVPPEGQTIPTLYAERSDFQSILNGLTTTLSGASTAVDRLNGFLDNNDKKLDATVDNIQNFSAALAANSDGLKTFLASISDVGQQIGPMASDIRGLSSDLRTLVQAVPPGQVTQVSQDVSTFTASLARNSAQMDEFFATATKVADNLNDVSTGLKSATTTIDQVTQQIDPAAIGRVVANVDTLTSKLGANADNISTVIANVTTLSDSLNKSAADVSTFTGMLAQNSGQIDTIIGATANLSGSFDDIAAGLKTAVASIEQVTKAVDPAAINRVVANIDSFSSKLGANAQNVDTVMANVTTLSDSLNKSAADVSTFTSTLSRSSGQIDTVLNAAATLATNLNEITTGLKSTVATIDQVTKAVDPAAIGRVVANVDTFSGKLGENAGNIDTVMTNLTTLSTSLNQSATTVDAILARVNGMVSTAGDEGLFDELTAAAKSVHTLADQLNASTSRIASGLGDFTTGGLPNFTALAVDARATLQRLDRVVRNLESNPQSLIFGGQTVRDYDKH
ncbi:MAG TPA: MlaD family protein [Devosiaceae bacterium]|jgi:phospholipid/cholesterol/gamma-HCH transport system substrate-binding protein